MSFTVQQATLAREFQALSLVIDRKATIPILDHALVTFGPDGVTVCATNLDLALTARLEGGVGVTSGRIALPTPTVLALSQRLPVGIVTVTPASKAEAEIACGSVRARVPMMPPDDFPPVPSPSSVNVTVPAGVFLKAVGQVVFSMEDLTGSSQQGAYLHVRDGKCLLAASNHHQLSRATVPVEAPDDFEVQLDHRAWIATQKWLKSEPSDEPIAVSVNDRFAWFASRERVMACRRLHAKFPPYYIAYERIGQRTTRVPMVPLVEALKRQMVVAVDDTTKTLFDLSSTGLHIQTRTSKGLVEDDIAGVEWSGEPLGLCFNPRYVLETLAVMDAPEVQWSAKDGKSAVQFDPVGGDGPSVIVAPMLR